MTTSYVPPGWYALLDQLCNNILALTDDSRPERLFVRQVKKQLGALRFYVVIEGDDFLSESGAEFTATANERSRSLCYQRGAPGELKSHGG